MHTDRFRGACQLLLRGVVAASETGVVRDYFANESGWESPLRQQFCDLASRLRGHGECGQAAMVALRQLNGLYRTRFKSEHLPMLHGSLLDVLRECEWLLTAPPNLLTCGGDESRRIADVVVNVLGRMQEGGAKRPYSLITKFLHFCFPGTFAIYDSQAGRSIQMWAVFAFDDAVQGEKDAASGFDEDSLADTNGRGYRSVLDFYRGVWAANEANVQAALESKASEMQDRIRAESGQRDARVTAIDLIDKVLWRANGNPLRLGLAVPPSATAHNP
jgi:hypothetical protein